MSSITGSLATALRHRLRPGMTIALGDGVGSLSLLDDGTAVGETLSAAAREVGGIRLVLGWLPVVPRGVDTTAFDEVVALMPGWGLRELLNQPTARFVPTRLTGIAALLGGPLRPDLLVTRLARRDGCLHFTTEVSWQRAVVDAGTTTLAIVDDSAPAASAEPIDSAALLVVAHAGDQPFRRTANDPEAVHLALAEEVLRWIPAGARVQYGPGQLGISLLQRATVPLRVDTGMITDGVVDLDRRGLLIGQPTATYLLGGDELYNWADGRDVLHGIEVTHDLTRLATGEPFVAVNTAIEIDRFGQVNAEGRGDKVVGGIGGHPDYCLAGHINRGGLSIIAVPTSVNGRSPLVDRLSRPASTAAHDVDVVVTENGSADLRCASWSQREALISKLFDR
ncbi:acetyl-CoA hydrolase [Mycobacterium sp. E342]|uniref:acetyl-CoA hydrolase/transferase C-terminal domain-containing protein n=2 Tax=unclassified Mycobacterium TaxID=2642494 RepID=UPI0007FFF4FA|nr:acetyl-CoA hydrolase/transferase C-terminal domain-containing protein [Mycobacterium sp. E3247]OBH01648.1 acetyl-CoA hydrolase [Mycobacterium sp. E3247]OBH31507.1 acetyl-CoA hydrolase [Mycobacterium sp. E342]